MIAGKYLNPKNDVAFKHIFGTEKNKDILIAMLNAVLKKQLHKPIKDVEFIKTNLDPEVEISKQSIVDVLCRDQDGCKYIIEMQISGREGFEKRTQYYTAKAYSSQLKSGEEYTDLKAVIFLAFTNYVLFPRKKDYKCEHVILDKKTKEHDLKDFSFTFVELPKFAKQCDGNIAKLSLADKFYYFLDKAESMTDDDLKKLAGKDKVIRKAFEVLDRFSWNEVEIATYEKQEKNERDYISSLSFSMNQGIRKGRKEGRQEGKKEMYEELLKLGVSKEVLKKVYSNA